MLDKEEILEPFSRDQQDAMLAEINYSRNQLDADLVEIKEWLKRQHHLPPSRLTEKDFFLTMFLTGCKGDLARVKHKLDSYYTFRGQSVIFDNRDPSAPEYVAVCDNLHFFALPKLDKNKLSRILILALVDADLNKFDQINYSRKITNLAEMRLRLDEISVSNFVIVDCSGASVKHILRIKPFLLRDLARIGQDILPFRYSKLCFINAPTFVEIAVNNIIKPLMTKKLKQRLYVTSGGCEELYDHIDRCDLPKDFGGNAPSMQELTERWNKRVMEERDWYVNELSERTDESKRTSANDSEKIPYLGIKGSLKKLAID